MKRAGPDREQLKEERLPQRQKAGATRGPGNDKETEGTSQSDTSSLNFIYFEKYFYFSSFCGSRPYQRNSH